MEYMLTRQILKKEEVIVKARHTSAKINIDLSMQRSMPSITRNFQDYIRLIPQAKVSGDGVISLAGQNNRFNSFLLMDRHFKCPSIFRTSFAIEKKTRSGLIITIESILTKNINEVTFKNIDILPPLGKSSLPDSRNIYSFKTNPNKINLRSSGIKNPYAGIYLITTNNDKKGFAYNFTLSRGKQFADLSVNSSYTYGYSKVLFEITGPQNPASSQ